jgi:hypothetical protein
LPIANPPWRSMTLVGGGFAVSTLHNSSGVEVSQGWAATEFAHAQLGDKRLTARLMALAAAVAEHPEQSLPAACGNWAATKGAYRFLSNDGVHPADILVAHRQSTVERMGAHRTVLAVQDTTFCYFTTRPATRGLGPLRQGGSLGFCVHSCLAVTPEGLPLGLLGQQVWARPDVDSAPKRDSRGKRSTDGKESSRWHAMLESSARGLPPDTHVIAVADREGDIYEFFVEAERLSQDILVRSTYNRKLHAEAGYLWDTVERSDILGHLDIEVPRSDSKRARPVQLELRSARVTLNPPKYQPPKPLPPVTLTIVLAREHTPPTGAEPVCWLLLTSLLVSNAEDAKTCVRWYTQRWKIEQFHHVLKSGCGIEELQLEDLERLHRALAVYSVVAWRLLNLTLSARTTPNLPCTQALTSAEWQTLYRVIHRTRQVPDTPADLQTAVLWVARLGGFLARRGDGAPGVKVLWRGMRRLNELTEAWELFNSLD